MTYKLTNYDTVFNIKDQVYIPKDKDNKEYQSYLLWLSQGNTPEPADPLPAPLTAEQKLQTSGLTIDELKQLLGLS